MKIKDFFTNSYAGHTICFWRGLRAWPLSFFLILVSTGCLIPTATLAGPEVKSILLVTQDNKPYSRKIVESIKSQATFASIQFKQLDYKKLNAAQIEQYQLIITLGSFPAKAIARLEPATAVLNLLITHQLYTALNKNEQSQTSWSALILDQPLKRQIILIQYLLGSKVKIGFLLGPYSIKQLSQIENTAKQMDVQISVEHIENEDNLIPSVRNLINTSDVIFSLPDPVAFNSNTIRGILLLSYRNNIPVIGFSKSFVTAGALAAVYSTPEQIAQNAVELINQFMLDNGFNKPFHHPEYYSIITNNNVARTLGISADLNNKLADRIKELELSR